MEVWTCRFEVEDASPILYVYEVQLVPAVQRKGLGAFLMTVLKLVAKKSQLEAIMLTVLNVSVCFAHASGWFTTNPLPDFTAAPLSGCLACCSLSKSVCCRQTHLL